jgi:hypothetical protein
MNSRSGFSFRKLGDDLLRRLPASAEILPVFALITTMFYGWTLVVFLWKLPGWLFFLTAGEIAGIVAFQFTTNLIESIVVLLLLLVFSAVLPPRFFKEAFAVRGSAVALVLIGSMMLFLNRYVAVGPKFGENLSVWMLGSLFISFAIAALSTRIKILRMAISWLSDRLIVFLFVLLPLSALAVLYVIVQAFI